MAKKTQFLNIENISTFLENYNISNIDTELDHIANHLSSILSKYKQKKILSEDYEKGLPLRTIYPNYIELSLPKWIKEDIDKAKVVGKSQQTVILPDGKKYQINNSLNHLSGSEWTYFTNSVVNTQYKTSGIDSMAHQIRRIHPTPKPPQLMKSIVEFFTKEEELVLDYFMGVGGSLLGASLCNRRAIGIDLNYEYVKTYQKAANFLKLDIQSTLVGNSLELLPEISHTLGIQEGDVSLILIDPPYGNMMSKKKTGADIKVYGEVATPFTNNKDDLGNLELPDFYNKLKESIELALPFLKTKGHLVVFIKDLQPSKKETNLLHAEIIAKINEIPNIYYKGLKIWADQTSKLFPYGYPFSFVANQIHQYILVFRKEK